MKEPSLESRPVFQLLVNRVKIRYHRVCEGAKFHERKQELMEAERRYPLEAVYLWMLLASQGKSIRPKVLYLPSEEISTWMKRFSGG